MTASYTNFIVYFETAKGQDFQIVPSMTAKRAADLVRKHHNAVVTSVKIMQNVTVADMLYAPL